MAVIVGGGGSSSNSGGTLTALSNVQILYPSNGQTGVSLNPQVILQFNEAVTGVSRKTIAWTSNSGSGSNSGSDIDIPFTISNSSQIIYTLRLESGFFLESNTSYNVLVKNGITGAVSKNEVLPTPFNFTTGNPLAPTVNLTSPESRTNVSVYPIITLTFVEPVLNADTNTIQFESLNGQPKNITIIESINNRYTLNLSESLLSFTQYVVVVNSGIRSVATKARIVPTQFTFTSKLIGPLTAIGTESVSTGAGPWTITVSPDGKNAYVNNFFDHTISQYSRSESGILTPLGTVATDLQPSRIIISPDGANVYVISEKNGTISQYSRNESGILTAIGTATPVVTGASPKGISISPDGSNVYVSNYSDNTVSQYSRSSGGILTALSPATIATGSGPNGISISPDGSNVYVVNQGSGSNTVSQFSRSESGRLTTLIPATVATGSGPGGISISPDGSNGYVSNSNDNTVSQYSRSESGILTALIPATIATERTPQGITISPDGLNVYVANQGTTTRINGIISQYTRSDSGRLTAIGTVATSYGPVGISISSDGKNVYATNDNASTISQYSR